MSTSVRAFVAGATRTTAALLAVLAVAVGSFATSAFAAGGVKGTITSGGASGTPVANAVVMIEGPSQPAAADAPHAVMDQRQDAFVPRVVVVPVGATVDFPNRDAHLHNVFSTLKGKQHFDLGMYGQGETKSVTFDTPGVVPVRCNVHPGMEGYVVVHTNPYAAVSDAHGVYTIVGVPAGTYTLRVWDERLGERKTPVVIRDEQVQALDVRLDARP
jgi:plastocyanin